MARSEGSYDEAPAEPWLRSVVLPAVVFFVAAAVICGLVLSGAVRGDTIYAGPGEEPTTVPTVLIQPQSGE